MRARLHGGDDAKRGRDENARSGGSSGVAMAALKKFDISALAAGAGLEPAGAAAGGGAAASATLRRGQRRSLSSLDDIRQASQGLQLRCFVAVSTQTPQDRLEPAGIGRSGEQPKFFAANAAQKRLQRAAGVAHVLASFGHR